MEVEGCFAIVMLLQFCWLDMTDRDINAISCGNASFMHGHSFFLSRFD